MSVGALNKYLNGSEPGAFKAARLAVALGVDLNWLVTGTGSANAAARGLVGVPIYDVRLAAGAATFAEGAEQIGEMPFDLEFLRELGRPNADGLAVFSASGDSMYPTVADGARICATPACAKASSPSGPATSCGSNGCAGWSMASRSFRTTRPIRPSWFRAMPPTN